MPPPLYERNESDSTLQQPILTPGIPLRELDEVIIAHEEPEALRLQIVLEKSQEEAAQEMSISRPTFHRLINAGRKKIIEALVSGKAIKIEGGHYIMERENLDPANWKAT